MADPVSGHREVLTAKTPVRLAEHPVRMARLDIWALATNTTKVYVGAENVSAVAGSETGAPIDAGDSIWFEDVELSNIWLDVETSGEGVTWLAR